MTTHPHPSYTSFAGVDEAGRGPLAGPVVAAACLIPEGIWIPDVKDSKALTAQKRKKVFKALISCPTIVYGVGIVSHEEIDEINIFQATIRAMLQAVAQLTTTPECLLVDGLNLPHPHIPCIKIIHGDAISYPISAASIIAKETRDALMMEADLRWPEYGFAAHKGYGTAAHLKALERYGPCPIHRRTFAPVANAARDRKTCLKSSIG